MRNKTSSVLMKGGSVALIPICLYLLGWVNLGDVLEAKKNKLNLCQGKKKDSLLT